MKNRLLTVTLFSLLELISCTGIKHPPLRDTEKKEEFPITMEIRRKYEQRGERIPDWITNGRFHYVDYDRSGDLNNSMEIGYVWPHMIKPNDVYMAYKNSKD